MIHVLNFLRKNDIPNSFVDNDKCVKFKIGHLCIETCSGWVYVNDEIQGKTSTYQFPKQTLEVRSMSKEYAGNVAEFVDDRHTPEEFLEIFHQSLNVEFGRIKEKVLRQVEVFDIPDPQPPEVPTLSTREFELALKQNKHIDFLLQNLREASRKYSELSFFAVRWGERQSALERMIQIYSTNKALLKRLGKFFLSQIDDWSVLVDFLRRYQSQKNINS